MADPLVSVLPIHYSNVLAPNIHMHQFPLLTRPLHIPPSAAQSGKKIRARIKPKASRIEVHVPVDTRPEVWNPEKGDTLGEARAEDDQENGLEQNKSWQEPEAHRLTEVRMRSEHIPPRGAYMLGIVRDGRLHLHPISQTHQLRPTLTYMDVLLRKASRRPRAGDGSNSDSDDGPPPDPDDPVSVSPPKKDKGKKPMEAKEVNVSIRKTEDKGGQTLQGGLSGVRREILLLLREEDEEKWEDIEYCDGEAEESMNAFQSVFSQSEQELVCKTTLVDLLKDIPGL